MPQNPGYYDIVAEDMSLWHVLNNFPLEHWNLAAILFYHTDNCFLQNITKIHTFIQQYPMRYNVGSCCNRRPAIPIVAFEKCIMFYFAFSKVEFEPGAITFRVINNEHAAMGSVSQQSKCYMTGSRKSTGSGQPSVTGQSSREETVWHTIGVIMTNKKK
ncbi:intelectin-like [Seriola dumerili]|uniref:intelectin-like n=1 Tax=Seriola dumerili TaxID=41447 RepID=UPI000BBEA227|nr:intelectin-like [Seriola dumerili]